MRLTLRTLLAYLDDRLPPANAKELGQKIAKSPFATELVDRIREVKRRRRLALPDKPVAIIDANLVAEYLDDQLNPELVAKVEKEILASDAMLAEVASAHEILGLLHDPVTIEPRLRDRLYALDPTGKAEVVQALGSAPPAESDDASTAAAEWKPLPASRTSTRRMPVFILAGLVLLWIVIVISDADLFGPKQSIQPVAEAGQNANVLDNAAEAVQRDEAAVIAENHDAVSVQNDANLSARPAGNLETDVVIIAAGPDANMAIPVAPVAAQPDPVPLVVAADVPASTAGELPVGKVETAVVDQAPRAAFHLMSNNKTFFVFDAGVDRWLRLDQIPGGETISMNRNTINCETLLEHRWFTIAQPFSASLIAEQRGWNATLIGTLLARISSEQIQGLEVFSGRLKLSVDPTEPWADDSVPAFSLRTAGVTAIVVLKSKETLVGIEVVPIAASIPNKVQSDAKTSDAGQLLYLNGSDFEVKVTVITGEATLRLSGLEQEVTLSKGHGLSWLAPNPAESGQVLSAAENVTPDEGHQIAAIPAWLREEAKFVPEAEALKSEIIETLASGADPALAMIPLLSNRNPQLGIRAVYVLSATRDADHLLSALFDPLDESVHRAAIDALSRIANGSSAGRRSIRHALETRLPMAEVDLTMLLISGIGDAEARDANFCKSLVDLLNNDRLATRTLAFYRIQQYSEDRLGYNPEAESSRRRDAVRRWQRFLDRNGGKLVP